MLLLPSVLLCLFTDCQLHLLRRFKTEQTMSASMPAPATHSQPMTVAEYSVPSRAAASLGQLYFGVSQARGAIGLHDGISHA